MRTCVDCPPPSRPSQARACPYPGPRCSTHHRQVTKARKTRAHDLHVSRTYNVEPGFYARLLDVQDGKCAICRRATGKTKRLALDHNHKTGDPRGCLCGPCNRIIGMWFDDPETFRRAARYLENPPAAALLIADMTAGIVHDKQPSAV